MGMQVVTTWTCDRCGAKEEVPIGEIALGWNMLTELQVMIVEQTHALDTKMPDSDARKLCCNDCMKAFQSWFNAIAVMATYDTPVVPLEDRVERDGSTQGNDAVGNLLDDEMNNE